MEKDEVSISPRAIFEIVKDIQVGRYGREASGFLYGLPDNPIEVTSAFPSYSVKTEPQDNADASAKEEYIASVQNFQKTHLEELKRLNFDNEHVGTYTSANVGGKITFKDLYRQFEGQVSAPLLFTLVVSINGTSLSARAFRVNPEAVEFMKENDINQIGYINQKFFYENFVQELKVTFKLTPLDEVIVQEMLGRFNLISDVFKLRDMNTMQNQMLSIYESLDNITNEVNKAASDKYKILENREKRRLWIEDRKEKNIQRIAHKLEPKPLEDVDEEIPLLKQSPKRDAIDCIYDFKARAEQAVRELEDEKTKIAALQALSEK
jgi:hypothetical protein